MDSSLSVQLDSSSPPSPPLFLTSARSLELGSSSEIKGGERGTESELSREKELSRALSLPRSQELSRALSLPRSEES